MKKLVFYFTGAVLAILIGYTIKKYNLISLIKSKPKLTILGEKLKDFGEIKEGSNASHYFKFVNSGNAPLLIENIDSNCGCTVPTWNKKPIRSKKIDSFLVKYDTSILGPFSKNVGIYTNYSKDPITVYVRGIIIKKSK